MQTFGQILSIAYIIQHFSLVSLPLQKPRGSRKMCKTSRLHQQNKKSLLLFSSSQTFHVYNAMVMLLKFRVKLRNTERDYQGTHNCEVLWSIDLTKKTKKHFFGIELFHIAIQKLSRDHLISQQQATAVCFLNVKWDQILSKCLMYIVVLLVTRKLNGFNFSF